MLPILDQIVSSLYIAFSLTPGVLVKIKTARISQKTCMEECNQIGMAMELLNANDLLKVGYLALPFSVWKKNMIQSEDQKLTLMILPHRSARLQ